MEKGWPRNFFVTYLPSPITASFLSKLQYRPEDNREGHDKVCLLASVLRRPSCTAAYAIIAININSGLRHSSTLLPALLPIPIFYPSTFPFPILFHPPFFSVLSERGCREELGGPWFNKLESPDAQHSRKAERWIPYFIISFGSGLFLLPAYDLCRSPRA